MLGQWLTPFLQWFGLPLIPFLMVVLIIILLVKD